MSGGEDGRRPGVDRGTVLDTAGARDGARLPDELDLGTSALGRIRSACVGVRPSGVVRTTPVVTEAARSLVAASSELMTRVGVVYLVGVLEAFLILD